MLLLLICKTFTHSLERWETLIGIRTKREKPYGENENLEREQNLKTEEIEQQQRDQGAQIRRKGEV
jgi:hypothetical protein